MGGWSGIMDILLQETTLASGELVGQPGQGLNILDNTGLFAMVLRAILALHEGQPPWLTIQ
jgi:hypothetical protein